MNEEYKAYECGHCNKVTIAVASEVEDTMHQGRYLACFHCGSRNLSKGKPYSSLKECMSARKYKRNGHGAIEEVK